MATRRRSARARAAATPVLLAGLVLACAAAQADVLRRCEDSTGHITYSNQACPSGTAHERPVELRPAVEVPQGAGGKASQSGVLKLPDSPSAAVVPSERAPDEKNEQNKAQVAHCDDLVRRIEYSQQDMITATGAEKASAELGLRRLQDEYQANCVKR
jgi:hypothetical protein